MREEIMEILLIRSQSASIAVVRIQLVLRYFQFYNTYYNNNLIIKYTDCFHFLTIYKIGALSFTWFKTSMSEGMICFLCANWINISLRLRVLSWQIVVDPLVVVVNGNTQHLLRIFLSHYMSV